MKRFFLFALICLLLAPSAAGEKGVFVRHGKRDVYTAKLIYYYVYEPPEITEGMPLVIYLHGSSERGENALVNSLPLYVKEGTVLCENALLMVPQMPNNYSRWWAMNETLMSMIDDVIARYGVDESRIALTGYSMGGLGAFDLAGAYPGRFSRVMPVAGRINEEIFIDAFEPCQVKICVGKRDETVNPATARAFAKAMIDAEMDAELLEFDATHPMMPKKVYQNQELLQFLWMDLGSKAKK